MKRGEPVIKFPPPTVYPNAIDNVKLRPKLKKPDGDVAAEEATTDLVSRPKSVRRMMGFREWCDKSYDKKGDPLKSD